MELVEHAMEHLQVHIPIVPEMTLGVKVDRKCSALGVVAMEKFVGGVRDLCQIHCCKEYVITPVGYCTRYGLYCGRDNSFAVGSWTSQCSRCGTYDCDTDASCLKKQPVTCNGSRLRCTVRLQCSVITDDLTI